MLSDTYLASSPGLPRMHEKVNIYFSRACGKGLGMRLGYPCYLHYSLVLRVHSLKCFGGGGGNEATQYLALLKLHLPNFTAIFRACSGV